MRPIIIMLGRRLESIDVEGSSESARSLADIPESRIACLIQPICHEPESLGLALIERKILPKRPRDACQRASEAAWTCILSLVLPPRRMPETSCDCGASGPARQGAIEA